MTAARTATRADRELVAAARRARANAHAPYSDFAVGAALRTRRGRVFAGCNVENASLGAGICAERGAVMAAVAAGMQPGDLQSVAVYTGTGEPTPPCGICRQVLVEFGQDVDIWLASPGRLRHTTLAALYPQPFTSFRAAARRRPRRR